MRPINQTTIFVVAFVLVTSCCIFRNAACQRIGDCPPGVLEPNCSQPCPSGKFGHNCSSSCPPDCLNHTCDVTSGHCMQCQVGFSGPQCRGRLCPDGFYGQNCSLKCPSGCSNYQCDSSTGHCLECNQGFLGPKCSVRIDEKNGDEIKKNNVNVATSEKKSRRKKFDSQILAKQVLVVFLIVLASVLLPVCVILIFLCLMKLRPNTEKLLNLLWHCRRKRQVHRCIYRPSSSICNIEEPYTEGGDGSFLHGTLKRFLNRGSVKSKTKEGDSLQSQPTQNDSFDAGFSCMLHSKYYLDNELAVDSNGKFSGPKKDHSRRVKRRVYDEILENSVIEISNSGLFQSSKPDQQDCDDFGFKKIQETGEESNLTSMRKETIIHEKLSGRPQKSENEEDRCEQEEIAQSGLLRRSETVSSFKDLQNARRDNFGVPQTRETKGTSLVELETGQCPVYMETTTPVPKTKFLRQGIPRSLRLPRFLGRPNFLGNSNLYLKNVFGRLRDLLTGTKIIGPANDPIDKSLKPCTGAEEAALHEMSHSGDELRDVDHHIFQTLPCGQDEGKSARILLRIEVQSPNTDVTVRQNTSPLNSQKVDREHNPVDASHLPPLISPGTSVGPNATITQPPKHSSPPSISDSHRTSYEQDVQSYQKYIDNAPKQTTGRSNEEMKTGVSISHSPLAVNEFEYWEQIFSSQKCDSLLSPYIYGPRCDDHGSLVCSRDNLSQCGGNEDSIPEETAGRGIEKKRSEFKEEKEFEEEEEEEVEGVYGIEAIDLHAMNIWNQQDCQKKGFLILKSATSVTSPAGEKRFTEGIFKNEDPDYLDLFLREDSMHKTSIKEISINCNQPLKHEKYSYRNIINTPQFGPKNISLPTSHPILTSNLLSVNTAPIIGTTFNKQTRDVQNMKDLSDVLNQSAMVYVQHKKPQTNRLAGKRLSADPAGLPPPSIVNEPQPVLSVKTSITSDCKAENSVSTTAGYKDDAELSGTESTSTSQEESRSSEDSKSCPPTDSASTDSSSTEKHSINTSSFGSERTLMTSDDVTTSIEFSFVPSAVANIKVDEETGSCFSGGKSDARSSGRKANSAVRSKANEKMKTAANSSHSQCDECTLEESSRLQTEEFFSDDEDSLQVSSSEGVRESQLSSVWDVSCETMTVVPKPTFTLAANASYRGSEMELNENSFTQPTEKTNSQVLTPSPDWKVQQHVEDSKSHPIPSQGFVPEKERVTETTSGVANKKGESKWIEPLKSSKDYKKAKTSRVVYVPFTRFKSHAEYSPIDFSEKNNVFSDGAKAVNVSQVRPNSNMSSNVLRTMLDRAKRINVPKSVTFKKGTRNGWETSGINKQKITPRTLDSTKKVGRKMMRNQDTVFDTNLKTAKSAQSRRNCVKRTRPTTIDVTQDNPVCDPLDISNKVSPPRKRYLKGILLAKSTGLPQYTPSLGADFYRKEACARESSQITPRTNISPTEGTSDTDTQYYSVQYDLPRKIPPGNNTVRTSRWTMNADSSESETSLYTAKSSFNDNFLKRT